MYGCIYALVSAPQCGSQTASVTPLTSTLAKKPERINVGGSARRQCLVSRGLFFP